MQGYIMLKGWRWYFGFIGTMLLIILLALLLTGCGGNVDRIVESPLERDAGIGMPKDAPQGVPTWSDVASGTLEGNASGTAVIYEKGGFRNLRLEGFFSQGCDQAKVYLSDGRERVALGPLQHAQGDSGYGIPSFVDIKEYGNVVVWCDERGYAIGSARLK